MTYLYCTTNELTSLDVSNCAKLRTLACGVNLLSSLDVGSLTKLEQLYCQDNQLTSLTLKDLEMLKRVYCGENQLSSLTISNLPQLNTLHCESNQLQSLDVTSFEALEDLTCSKNQLTSLNVSGLAMLEQLYCAENELADLELSGCTSLVTLDCKKNRLTSLDISGCTALCWLDCDYNQLTFSNRPLSLPVQGGFYRYRPQNEIPIGSGGIVIAGEEIDLSAEARVGTVNTVFTWYYSEHREIDPTWASDGRFGFAPVFAGKSIYCVMTNAALPDLTLQTTAVQVVAADYDDHDTQRLRDFLEQSDSSGVKNGNKVFAAYDPDVPGTWRGVEWSTSEPKKVI